MTLTKVHKKMHLGLASNKEKEWLIKINSKPLVLLATHRWLK